MAKKKNPIDDLVSQASKFVDKQKGRWDHAAWEKLLKDVSSTGIEMSDDTRRHLGNMLESVKHFYDKLSKQKSKAKKKSGPKKAASKKKAGATKKSATKKKSVAKKKKAATKKKS